VHYPFVDAVDTVVPLVVEVVIEEPDEVEADEDEEEADGDVGFGLLPHPTKPTATTEPMNERTSRRLKGELSCPLLMATPQCKRWAKQVRPEFPPSTTGQDRNPALPSATRDFRSPIFHNLFQGLHNRRLRQRRHHRVPFRRWMKVIAAELAFQHAGVVDQLRVVIEIHVLVSRRI
jgi:hypothetical protein